MQWATQITVHENEPMHSQMQQPEAKKKISREGKTAKCNAQFDEATQEAKRKRKFMCKTELDFHCLAFIGLVVAVPEQRVQDFLPAETYECLAFFTWLACKTQKRTVKQNAIIQSEKENEIKKVKLKIRMSDLGCGMDGMMKELLTLKIYYCFVRHCFKLIIDIWCVIYVYARDAYFFLSLGLHFFFSFFVSFVVD